MSLVTRFAPSPTGELHLGHAYSALTAWRRAREAGGTFLLRIEDIDLRRCKREFETTILADLAWLVDGMVRCAGSPSISPIWLILDGLSQRGLVYPLLPRARVSPRRRPPGA
jgi:glutamyl-Q tRNA(Asp) synthetase